MAYLYDEDYKFIRCNDCGKLIMPSFLKEDGDENRIVNKKPVKLPTKDWCDCL